MERRTGAIDSVAGMGMGDHACWAYSSDEEHRDALTRYLRDGLESGQRLAFYGSPDERAELALDYLRDAGCDVDTLLRQGALVVGAASEAYVPDGVFEPEARLDAYRRMVDAALHDGFTGLRVAAELSWLIDVPGSEHWPAYELRADLLAARLPFTALCCYDAREWDPQRLAVVMSVHALALGGEALDVETGFHLHGRRDGSIGIAGELDLANAETVRALVASGVGEAAEPVLDLTDLRFADLTGVRAVAQAAEALAASRGGARIHGGTATFHRTWELLGLEEKMATMGVTRS